MTKNSTTRPLHEAVVIKETITPYRNDPKVSSVQVCAMQSLVFCVLGSVAAVVALFLTTWPIGVLAAMPIVGMAYPWLREAWSAHGLQSKHNRMQHNTLAIELAAQERALGDYNLDGVIDEEDAIQFEKDIALYAIRITNIKESMTKRHWWKARGWRHDRWKSVVKACADAGVIVVSVSRKTGAVTPRQVIATDGTSAVVMLANAGYFVETDMEDHLPRKGIFVKNPMRSVSSDGWNDGPITNLPSNRPTETPPSPPS